MTDKHVKSWGNNRAGQLGDGTWADLRTSATAVHGLTGAEVIRIAAGGAGAATGHGLALLAEGTVRSWGANESGQLGDGTGFGHNTPGRVVNLRDVTDVAAGGAHSLALLAEGTVFAWGRNIHGQLGDGTTADNGVPVRVEGLTEVVAIAAGLHHSVALREDGTVWAWGRNVNGQLGDGTSTSRTVPVPVKGLSGVTRIAAGAGHSLALIGTPGRATTLKAWGHNDRGQLGDNTTINRYTPVSAQGHHLAGITHIAAGAGHSLALVDGGNLRAWGRNTCGQLGDGTTDFRAAPVPVPGMSGIRLVAGGREHTVVLLADNTLRSWGHNSSGQLGDGTTIDSPTPVTT
ncbi:hypothetical protein, partial [Streptomyces sp. FH025]|uniref:RCC1 domain-containing protein n=1 Tax=Streptomyces sp. FH025 TaxID=2815937 RepID=UPI001A9D5034